MAAMMLMLINFNKGCISIVSISIIEAISWPPPLIFHNFCSPRLLKAAPFFHSLAVFEWISLLFVGYKAPKPAYG